VLTDLAVPAHLSGMSTKSQHLQIRVTPRQKAALKRMAGAAGLDVSSYVLARALPPAQRRFEELLALLAGGDDEARYALAELNDLLSGLARDELRDAVAHADVARLSPWLANYVAAMVEQACCVKGVARPGWTGRVAPLETPWFATSLKSLRLHLLRSSLVAFKRRNLFVDSSIGARV
jgi:uncharacterized protein (DUF1778 family)